MARFSCFIDEPGLFDALLFSVSPRESRVVNLQMFLTLVTAYQTFERADYVRNCTTVVAHWYVLWPSCR